MTKGLSFMSYTAAAATDNTSLMKLTESILSEGGFDTVFFTSSDELINFSENNKPDIILLDLDMDDSEGFDTMNRLHMSMDTVDIPVMVMSYDGDPDLEAQAFDEGAIDFIVKPFSEQVFLRRVTKVIEITGHQSALENKVSSMTEEILQEHQKNERLSLQIVKTLAGTIDAKDSFTNGHSLRVAEYAREIARRAGYSQKGQDEMYMIGLLHDVGKVGVPDSIINKPSRLTDEEFAIIKTHPVLGFDILKNITEMPKLAAGARWHHERFDGKGYPDGLRGHAIPEEARIIAVADAYDAMSSKRSFHNINEQDYVLAEFRRGRGIQFDPAFAEIMIKMIQEDKEYRMKEQEARRRAESTSVDIANTDEKTREKGAVLLRMLEACGINIEAGMKYCTNDVNIYIEMLNEFTSASADRLKKLQNSFIAEKWDDYGRNIHSLKNVAKSIGADALAESASVLEDAIKKKAYIFIRRNHPDMAEQFETVSENILAVTTFVT